MPQVRLEGGMSSAQGADGVSPVALRDWLSAKSDSSKTTELPSTLPVDVTCSAALAGI